MYLRLNALDPVKSLDIMKLIKPVHLVFANNYYRSGTTMTIQFLQPIILSFELAINDSF